MGRIPLSDDFNRGATRAKRGSTIGEAVRAAEGLRRRPRRRNVSSTPSRVYVHQLQHGRVQGVREKGSRETQGRITEPRMDDRRALMAAIIANPDEDTPRLALADWLDEHGDAHDRA